MNVSAHTLQKWVENGYKGAIINKFERIHTKSATNCTFDMVILITLLQFQQKVH